MNEGRWWSERSGWSEWNNGNTFQGCKENVTFCGNIAETVGGSGVSK